MTKRVVFVIIPTKDERKVYVNVDKIERFQECATEDGGTFIVLESGASIRSTLGLDGLLELLDKAFGTAQ